MNVYLDTSVLLSRLLVQPNALPDWGNWDMAYSSLLCRVEFLRTADRLRLEGSLDDPGIVELRTQFEEMWQALARVRISDAVLSRASEPFPTVLGTLDAIHLASALIVNRLAGDACIEQVLTHDEQLGRAARALGFGVQGVSLG